MSKLAAINTERRIARPLKTLVPLIQEELAAGDSAGLDHYRRAGEMLNEARAQVAAFKWGTWLSKNFALSRMTASRYMRLAEVPASRIAGDTTLHEAIGETHTRTPRLGDTPVSPRFPRAIHIDREALTQERQTQTEEIQLHRELAVQLVEAGYRALATRLHPDQGGSKDAMRRLNRVRDDLKSLATTRRFV